MTSSAIGVTASNVIHTKRYSLKSDNVDHEDKSFLPELPQQEVEMLKTKLIKDSSMFSGKQVSVRRSLRN